MQTHTKLFYLIEAEGTEREKKEINQGDVQMEAAKPQQIYRACSGPRLFEVAWRRVMSEDASTGHL